MGVSYISLDDFRDDFFKKRVEPVGSFNSHNNYSS
jgi:hypothetical protein